jgi:hypothetical protein
MQDVVSAYSILCLFAQISLFGWDDEEAEQLKPEPLSAELDLCTIAQLYAAHPISCAGLSMHRRSQ